MRRWPNWKAASATNKRMMRARPSSDSFLRKIRALRAAALSRGAGNGRTPSRNTACHGRTALAVRGYRSDSSACGRSNRRDCPGVCWHVRSCRCPSPHCLEKPPPSLVGGFSFRRILGWTGCGSSSLRDFCFRTRLLIIPLPLPDLSANSHVLPAN